MENIWKVSHSGKIKDSIKTTVRVQNTQTIGVHLKEGEFILAMPYVTAQLDAQAHKRGFLNIEENYDNSLYGFEIGKVYSENSIDQLRNSF